MDLNVSLSINKTASIITLSIVDLSITLVIMSISIITVSFNTQHNVRQNNEYY
jgi:hypothetical protein